MFGRSREIEREIAQTTTTLSGHLTDCSRRYDETKEAFKTLSAALEKSTEERRQSIKELSTDFDRKHRENRKFFMLIFLAALPVLIEKAWAVIAHISNGGH